MTRAQRSHDDALGKTTTPFSDSGARRDLIQDTKKKRPTISGGAFLGFRFLA
jgi:hypothetical protein